MKQSLDLRLGQHLTITPQLQQAIRLLQLSSLELQQEIQEALENNPLLEEVEDESAAPKAENEERERELAAGEVAESVNGEDTFESTTPAESGLDTAVEGEDGTEEYASEPDWDDNFASATNTAERNEQGDGLPDIDARNSAPLSLREHLLWQMQMSIFSENDMPIALALIDAISDDGYLSTSLEDIRQSLSADLEIDVEEIEAVLHQIQNFDPIGVGARNLSECLLLQLRPMGPDTPHLAAARQLAKTENLDLLASRDFKALRRSMKLPAEELQEVISIIQSLNPRPGGTIQSSSAAYIVPDILVKKVRGVWRADLTSNSAPRLRVNNQYEKMIGRGNASADNKYLQERLQEARWFIKSLASRNETLLKVARAIVDRQRAFFEHGPEAMKPLVLHDIAEIVEMHESTISRVTTHKYMLTPGGISELKYFFSSHVSTADGGTCSATAIRSLIKKLVEAEKATKPISDSKIAEILEEQGIHVARRTVAKYREALNIPPSSLRKSLI